jgi:hypothetical protein
MLAGTAGKTSSIQVSSEVTTKVDFKLPVIVH